MGWGECRFKEETDCRERGSIDYRVTLPDIRVRIDVPVMWKHYMLQHFVQPTEREREIIMSADPSQASGRERLTRSLMEEVRILYVEKTSRGYTHEVGTEPDTKFIEKLERILSCTKPRQTKNFGRHYLGWRLRGG